MEIEKVMTVAAPPAQVWRMLLDPHVMGSCVPGMKSVEVVSDTEYIAVIQVKISFISAKFKLKTTIVEQQAPRYLRCVGTGEDASVASSLKQQTELFLTELPGSQTELRLKVQVDVLGRLSTFGLSVMKTKADRLWEEFGQNLVARLEAGPDAAAAVAAPAVVTPIPCSPPAAPTPAQPPQAAPSRPIQPPPGIAVTTATAPRGWWSRLLGRGDDRIRIALRRGDVALTADWPATHAADCAAWLREVLK